MQCTPAFLVLLVWALGVIMGLLSSLAARIRRHEVPVTCSTPSLVLAPEMKDKALPLSTSL